MIVDPNWKEEQMIEGRMTLTLNAHRELCAVQKAGGTPLAIEQILQCARIAAVKAEEISQVIQQALKEDAADRKSVHLFRFLIAERQACCLGNFWTRKVYQNCQSIPNQWQCVWVITCLVFLISAESKIDEMEIKDGMATEEVISSKPTKMDVEESDSEEETTLTLGAKPKPSVAVESIVISDDEASRKPEAKTVPIVIGDDDDLSVAVKKKQPKKKTKKKK